MHRLLICPPDACHRRYDVMCKGSIDQLQPNTLLHTMALQRQ
jgi:hypothetical protein